MTRLTLFALASVAFLAGCGADGEPTPPEPSEDKPAIGLSITGKAEIGITG
jgi:uncharacterized lipoprotein YajG